jgi:YHS domain-containing protein
MSNMTMAAVALSLLAIAPASPRQSAHAPSDALDGVDVVVLLQEGKEVFGKSAIHSVHAGFTYLFASAENTAQFDKAPDKYAIQLGGLCARMGGTVTGNPSDYVVHEGKIYIFGSDACHKLFVAAPAKYLPPTAVPLPTASDAVKRGRALLDKAAAAHGGAKLDAASSYAEAWTVTQQRPTGPVSIANKAVWRFPDAARTERIVPTTNGPMTIVTLMTPAGAWSGLSDDVSEPPQGVLPGIQRALWRQLLPLLRTRGESSVKVAAIGSAAIEGQQLERVRMVKRDIDVTFNLDAASGRVHSMTYVDRGSDGVYGQISIAYGDLKPVDGVLVPFTETGSFNGTPNAPLTRRLDTATVNAPVDAQLFARPAGAGK